MSRGFERSQHRSRGRARRVGHRGEIFLADVDFNRWGALRRQIPASPEAQQHRDAALDVIAEEEVVRGADGGVIMSDGREAEKSPGARVGRHDLPDGGKRQMQEF